jgi:hypothetical protein
MIARARTQSLQNHVVQLACPHRIIAVGFGTSSLEFRISKAKAAPMIFLTKQKFQDRVDDYQKRFPNTQHWNQNRWIYHEIAVNLLMENTKEDDKILEIGPAGVQLVEGSDILDYRVPKANWPVQDPTYHHDAKKFPWPISDLQYEFVVALRVFQHLAPVQKEAFKEAARISKNVLIVVPSVYVETAIGSQAIDKKAFVDWNDGREPTKYIPTSHGDVYFWNASALR